MHGRKECKHGTLVAQCRCMCKDKTVQIVPCPDHCRYRAREEYVPKHAAPDY